MSTTTAVTTMKQWVFPAGGTSIDQLTLQNAAIPTPGPGQVRVRMHAVSLNFRDQLLLMGAYGGAPTEDLVVVSDGAGEVDAVGHGVTEWSVGDRVTSVYYPDWRDGPLPNGLGLGPGAPGEQGFLAEYVVRDAGRLIAAPQHLTMAEAATLPCAGLTGWTALYGNRPYRRTLGADDTVLVLGSGGVSLMALQLAAAAGAQVVATSSSDDKLVRARRLGATHTINYRTTPNWGEAAFELSGGAALVVNSVGSSAIDQAVVALANDGEIAMPGFMNQSTTSPDFVALMTKAGSIRGTRVGSRAAHADLVAALDRTAIAPVVHRTFALDETPEAYRAGLAPDLFGKVVVDVSGSDA